MGTSRFSHLPRFVRSSETGAEAAFRGRKVRRKRTFEHGGLIADGLEAIRRVLRAIVTSLIALAAAMVGGLVAIAALFVGALAVAALAARAVAINRSRG